VNSHNRLIVVSNRLPFSVKRTDDSHAIDPSSGGLVTALRAVFRRYEGCWIGWTGTEYSPAVEDLIRTRVDEDFQVHPVFLTKKEKAQFYSGFSNEIVWPLFHDLQSRCNFDPEYWDSYVRINERFADRVSKVARDEDFIWVHDYHLTRVAACLRERGLRSSLAFFQHIPFPSPDIFEKLPWREEFLNAMLDFDLVGLQTNRDRQNFAVCVERFAKGATLHDAGDGLLVERQNQRTRVDSFPISIDFEEFSSQAATPEVTALSQQIRDDMRGRSLILGVDRLDYTKGLPEKLKAFGRLLSESPELRRKVTLLQVVVPSREDIPKYRDLKLEVERFVSQINGRYTDSSWVPIHFIYRPLERTQLLAHYRAADVALVTPLKDGMNLVAKEYCAAQLEEDGVLVLSEFAGAASQLEKDAILVNPNDVTGVASAIRLAVLMKRSERQHRMKNLRRVVRQSDVRQWSEAFLRSAGVELASKTTPPENKKLAIVPHVSSARAHSPISRKLAAGIQAATVSLLKRSYE
jgi:alpha,alpha-trehalose-phosphate synthase [UDP-forming]